MPLKILLRIENESWSRNDGIYMTQIEIKVQVFEFLDLEATKTDDLEGPFKSSFQ